MTSTEAAPRARGTFGDRLLEIIAVLLLGVATLGTAWCGYQSSQWNGAQGDLARAASDERIEASRLFGLATQKVAYDAAIVAQYAQAAASGEDRLLEFYRESVVRPDFLPLLQEWEQEVRAGGSPGSLFENQEYLEAQFQDYRAAEQRAEAETQASEAAGRYADAYVLTTILLAVALFFAGVVGSFRYRPARFLLLVASVATIAFAAVRVSGLPVA